MQKGEIFMRNMLISRSYLHSKQLLSDGRLFYLQLVGRRLCCGHIRGSSGGSHTLGFSLVLCLRECCLQRLCLAAQGSDLGRQRRQHRVPPRRAGLRISTRRCCPRCVRRVQQPQF
jgi:hypothetical protein